MKKTLCNHIGKTKKRNTNHKEKEKKTERDSNKPVVIKTEEIVKRERFVKKTRPNFSDLRR